MPGRRLSCGSGRLFREQQIRSDAALPQDHSRSIHDAVPNNETPQIAEPQSSAWAEGLETAHSLAMSFLTSLRTGPVNRHVDPAEMAARFNVPLPETGRPAGEVVREWFT